MSLSRGISVPTHNKLRANCIRRAGLVAHPKIETGLICLYRVVLVSLPSKIVHSTVVVFSSGGLEALPKHTNENLITSGGVRGPHDGSYSSSLSLSGAVGGSAYNDMREDGYDRTA